MNNQQKMETSSELRAEVLKLSLVDNLSARKIAQRLSIGRNTVRKLLNCAKPTQKPKSTSPRESILDPYKAEIKALLDDIPTIKAPAVLERLRPLGYIGGVTIVRDYLQQTRPRRQKEAFLTLDFHPGAAMQVDWADFGYAICGCPRRVSALVMVLCYSRYLYLEFTLSQNFGTFVRAMERGLSFFTGTTTVDIFDNMKTVVLVHNHKTIQYNQQFLAYAQTRHFGVLACNVARGNEKGRVERPIGFIRERFWPGRRFISLFDLNQQATAWRDDYANNRAHDVTGKIPALVFKFEEKHVLRPLTQNLPFETDDIFSTTVTKLFRIRFDRNTYSVPPRLVSQTVLVRANDEVVAVYLGPKQVALHRRCFGIGEDIEDHAHRSAALEIKQQAAPKITSGALGAPLESLGEIGTQYFKAFVAGKRSMQREITRLILLCELFSPGTVADAIKEVMATGHVGAEYIEYVLRHKRGLVPSPAPLRLGNPQLDALNFAEPDLSLYDQLTTTHKTLDPGPLPDIPSGEV